MSEVEYKVMKVDATLSQTHSLPKQPSCGSLKSRSWIYPSPVASLIYPDGQANIHSSSCFFYHSPTGQSTTYTERESKSLVSFFLVCPLISRNYSFLLPAGGWQYHPWSIFFGWLVKEHVINKLEEVQVTLLFPLDLFSRTCICITLICFIIIIKSKHVSRYSICTSIQICFITPVSTFSFIYGLSTTQFNYFA